MGLNPSHDMVDFSDLLSALQSAIGRAQQHLLELQAPKGYWIGELVVDSTLCSDFVAFMHWANEVEPDLEAKCIRHILDRQLPDGGWNIYPEGPSELNATVKAYFALKLAGYSAEDPRLERARQRALALGGIEKTNTYARLYLALLGQVPWDAVPTIPVEFLIVPRWSPIHFYAVSSWTRSMVVPLAIINHYKSTKTLPPEKGIQELYVQPDKRPRLQASGLKKLFLLLDWVFKQCENRGLMPFRRYALQEAERWMIERIGDGNDGLAAIFPAMLNSIIALRCLGYATDHPLYRKAEADFRALFVDDEKGFRIQPCFSPVWDTAITSLVLVRSGVSIQEEPLRRAADWLADQEIRIAGDWAVRNPKPEPSGWCFEFNNPYNPDTDDTAMVLLALRTAGYVPHDPLLYDRGLRWLLSFQCRDGGWAAFDKDITNPLLEAVPFADHNAILDPTCANITARVLEVLASFDFPTSHTVVSRAIRYLRRRQEPDGSWYGRWGVNYVYGTWQVLKGLNAIGLNMNQRWIQRGREWLERHQNADGGWGESCGSYNQPSLRGRGKSTPSQTAWALMGLLSFPDCNRNSIRRGVEFLLQNQEADGSWGEHLITGTGFPRVFYLKYDMYRNNWPLLALAMYEKRLSAELDSELESVESASRTGESMTPAFSGAVASVASLPGVEFLKELFARLNHG
jgi:squalene-hopene/tetraprenyl-beta-curcumene cyclase